MRMTCFDLTGSRGSMAGEAATGRLTVPSVRRKQKEPAVGQRRRREASAFLCYALMRHGKRKEEACGEPVEET